MVASYGHVRDLPPRAGSVAPKQNFKLSWEVSARGARQLAEIADALSGPHVKTAILATDPDREGEAIAWHVTNELKVRVGAACSQFLSSGMIRPGRGRR